MNLLQLFCMWAYLTVLCQDIECGLALFALLTVCSSFASASDAFESLPPASILKVKPTGLYTLSGTKMPATTRSRQQNHHVQLVNLHVGDSMSGFFDVIETVFCCFSDAITRNNNVYHSAVPLLVPRHPHWTAASPCQWRKACPPTCLADHLLASMS